MAEACGNLIGAGFEDIVKVGEVLLGIISIVTLGVPLVVPIMMLPATPVVGSGAMVNVPPFIDRSVGEKLVPVDSKRDPEAS